MSVAGMAAATFCAVSILLAWFAGKATHDLALRGERSAALCSAWFTLGGLIVVGCMLLGFAFGGAR